MITKRCGRCKETKDKDLFFNNRGMKDGKDAMCKVCRQANSKAYFNANPDKVRLYTHRARAKKAGVSYEEYVKGLRKYNRRTTAEEKDSA